MVDVHEWIVEQIDEGLDVVEAALHALRVVEGVVEVPVDDVERVDRGVVSVVGEFSAQDRELATKSCDGLEVSMFGT